MDARVSDLLRDLKVTSGCRFISANRLRRRDSRTAILIAVASVIVIALTVLPFIYKLTSGVSSDLSVATLVMSLVILAASLLQYSSGDAATAEQHHRCGLEVRELRRRLRDQAETIENAALGEITHAYNAVLQKYSINHDEIDFRQYQIEHPSEFALSGARRFAISVQLLVAGRAAYMLMIAAKAVVFGWLIFWHVLPARILESNLPPHSN